MIGSFGLLDQYCVRSIRLNVRSLISPLFRPSRRVQLAVVCGGGFVSSSCVPPVSSPGAAPHAALIPAITATTAVMPRRFIVSSTSAPPIRNARALPCTPARRTPLQTHDERGYPVKTRRLSSGTLL